MEIQIFLFFQQKICSVLLVFVMPSILQSRFTVEGFKKAENFEHCVVFLLFLFTLDKNNILREYSDSFIKSVAKFIPNASY